MQRQGHGGGADEHGDRGQEQHAEAQARGDAEQAGTRAALAAQERLVHERGLGSFAIDGQEGRQSEGPLPAQFQAAAACCLRKSAHRLAWACEISQKLT